MRNKRNQKRRQNKLKSDKNMLSNNFKINLNGLPCTIVRSKHVRARRNGIFRDYGLNKVIYEQILSLGAKHVKREAEFIITWEHNSSNNAIVGQFLTKNTIRIVSACVSVRSAPEKIYAKYHDNRYHIGSVKYDNKN